MHVLNLIWLRPNHSRCACRSFSRDEQRYMRRNIEYTQARQGYADVAIKPLGEYL